MLVRRLLGALLVVSLTVGPAPASDQSTSVHDSGDLDRRVIPKNVELHKNGTFEFALVDSLGRTHQARTATVIANETVKSYQPNSSGKFFVPVQKSGIVVVSDGNYTYGCRVWKHGTAPPKSLKSIAFVQKADAVAEVRGNALGAALKSTERLYGLALLGLGGVALWQALDRDDAS